MSKIMAAHRLSCSFMRGSASTMKNGTASHRRDHLRRNWWAFRIRQTQDLRLFRPDTDMPVLRGTAVTMSKREGYLWSTGYIPRLRTYPGFETTKPLLVEINRGEDDLVKVRVTFLVSPRSIITRA